MGKSTFLNFLVQTLETRPDTIIVRFAPWLVDDRNALLHELFTEMSRSLEPVENRHGKRWDVGEYRNRRIAAQRLRRFARVAERLKSLPAAPHLSWFKDLGALPVIREVTAISRFAISTVAAFKPKDETLRQLREDIATRLSLLKYKIVVVVDDVDRLESAEAREVFRLVRAVADFPNTTYLVAFDRAPLDFDGQRGPDIARSYLDKIIQVPIFLPEAEVTDLRRILTHMLTGGSGRPGVIVRPLRSSGTSARRNGEQERLSAALDPLARTYLNSPRRIGIIHNVLMTVWPSVSDDVDLCDLLIHLCLTNFDRPLAGWVDDYLAVRNSRRMRALSTHTATELRMRLDQLLNSSLRHREDRLLLLRTLLPSMRSY
jgi:hypothetical protein